MAVLASLPASSSAARITLRRDSVLPVVFSDTLTLNGNRTGDTFTARVEGDQELPNGTRLMGRVRSVRKGSTDADRGYMDLEFTSVVLPNGRTHRIYAVPIPLNDRYTSRDSDGRFRVKRDVKKKGTSVVVGALGGLILGSILKKPIEGAIVGTVAGIIFAEVNKKDDGNTVVQRGAKMGAMIERDVTLNIDDFDRYDGDYDRDRRDDGYDSRNDRYGLGKGKPRRGPDTEDDRIDSDRDIVVRYRNRNLRYTGNERPIRRGETVMVPLEATARQIGLSVDIDKESETIFVRGDDRDEERVLRVDVGSKRYRLNGRQGTLAQAVVRRNGKVYVPVDILSELTDENISVVRND